ncbi:hypothetical protein NJ7G_0600 [Natrinema sp. J7-2]|nr:hypothetical protein NJ7G_0600 [Natrinema sp. J7-2]
MSSNGVSRTRIESGRTGSGAVAVTSVRRETADRRRRFR